MEDKDLIHRDGKVYLILHCSEFVDDDNGGHFIHYDLEEDVTKHADREHNFCKLCGWSTYPECMDGCTKYIQKMGRE